MYDTAETWFSLETEQGGDYITITAMQGDHATGAAVAIPMDAAPFIANGILDLWCADDEDEEGMELGDDGWPDEGD